MAEVKCVISDPKAGKSYQKVLPENQFSGKSIGDSVSGSLFELPGYELKITGASDSAGFPHISRFEGSSRRKPLMKQGETGVHIKRKGMVVRKTIRGSLLNEATAQVNLVVVKYGTKKLPDLLGIEKKEEEKKPEPKVEEKKEPEAPKVEKKEEPKVEKTPEKKE